MHIIGSIRLSTRTRDLVWLPIAAAGLCLVLATACSSEQKPPPEDASDTPQCWSGGGTPTPGASVELGTGLSEFELIEPEQGLPLHRGPQGGAHFFLHARIRGISPGDVAGMEAPPTLTRFTIHGENDEDMTLLPCDYPISYMDNGDGSYQLEFARTIQIATAYLETAYGQRVRIQVEVQDGEGNYATDDAWVVVVDPEQDGGDPDAGAADAGTDAATGALDAGPVGGI